MRHRGRQLAVGGGQQQRRTAVGEDVRELALAGLGVDRDHGDAGLERADDRDAGLDLGRRPYGDARGVLDRGGDVVRGAGKFAVGQRAAAEAQRLAVVGVREERQQRCVQEQIGHDASGRDQVAQPTPSTTNRNQTSGGTASVMTAP